MKRRSFLGAGSVLAVSSARAGGSNDEAPAAVAPGRRAIPNVEVWTHEGRKARFYDDLVRGRSVTFNFMFTTCGGTCPLVTANLRRVQELLSDRVGRDLFMYSLTLQPELETPDVLKAYAEQNAVGPGWHFLTGAPADMERLRRALGFVSADPELDVVADEHTGMLRYGNDAIDRWSACPAAGRPEWIVKAVTTALTVAS